MVEHSLVENSSSFDQSPLASSATYRNVAGAKYTSIGDHVISIKDLVEKFWR